MRRRLPGWATSILRLGVWLLATLWLSRRSIADCGSTRPSAAATAVLASPIAPIVPPLTTGDPRMVAPYDRVDAYAADQLKFLRITQGVSQVILGKSAGVSSSQIQKYENRIDRITAGRLYHFAELFGVKVAVFFPPQHTETEDTVLPPVSLRFLRLFNQIPESSYDYLFAVLKALSELKPAGGQA